MNRRYRREIYPIDHLLPVREPNWPAALLTWIILSGVLILCVLELSGG